MKPNDKSKRDLFWGLRGPLHTLVVSISENALIALTFIAILELRDTRDKPTMIWPIPQISISSTWIPYVWYLASFAIATAIFYLRTVKPVANKALDTALELLCKHERARSDAEFDDHVYKAMYKIPTRAFVWVVAVIAVWAWTSAHYIDISGTAVAWATGGAFLAALIFNFNTGIQLYTIGDGLHMLAFSRRWLTSPRHSKKLIILEKINTRWPIDILSCLISIVAVLGVLSRLGLTWYTGFMSFAAATSLGFVISGNRLMRLSDNEAYLVENIVTAFGPRGHSAHVRPDWAWQLSPLAAVLRVQPADRWTARFLMPFVTRMHHVVGNVTTQVEYQIREIGRSLTSTDRDLHVIRSEIDEAAKEMHLLSGMTAYQSRLLAVIDRLTLMSSREFLDRGGDQSSYAGPLKFSKVVLADIIDEICAEYDDQKAVQIDRGELKERACRGDEQSLREAIGALLENAFLSTRRWQKQSGDSAPQILVQIRTGTIQADAEERHVLQIIIYNQGAPVSNDVVKGLFSPMNTGYGQPFPWQGRVVGQGLGLFFTNLIARAHGGSLEFEPLNKDPWVARAILSIPLDR